MVARLRARGLLGEMAAEFAGTMILILFGVGVVAQVVAGHLGNHDSITWAWGFGVALGVYTAGRVTGGHLNPAVTLALAVFSGFPWKKFIPYAFAQTLGAFVAALIVRWVYSGVLNLYDPGHTLKSQFVFSTLPGNGIPKVNGVEIVSLGGAFLDQIVGTAILLFCVFAITDSRNTSPLANMAPVVVGFLVVAIGMAWGTNAGYAINPARDFGPRLASYFTGYSTAWRDQYGQLYWWVPIVAPLIGGVLGAFLYKVLVDFWLPAAEPGAPIEGTPSAEPTVASGQVLAEGEEAGGRSASGTGDPGFGESGFGEGEPGGSEPPRRP